MRRRSLALAAAATVLMSARALASPCSGDLLGGVAPTVSNPKMLQDTRELCYPGFAVLHSGRTRTPLWSAEHLTRARIEAARDVPRVNTFHADENLPADERAELSDYARSGYDRGHMSPSGDAPDAESQQATFTLANMIPQNPDNNRNLWEGVEASVRKLAVSDGELFVVTGPIFEGGQLQALKGRVLVPTRIFKAVFDPSTGRSGAYLVNNEAGLAWQPISIARLREMTGIDPFPAAPEESKAAGMDLPFPVPHGTRGGVPPVASFAVAQAGAAPSLPATPSDGTGTAARMAETFGTSMAASLAARAAFHAFMHRSHRYY